jgi:hypothetical protein
MSKDLWEQAACDDQEQAFPWLGRSPAAFAAASVM